MGTQSSTKLSLQPKALESAAVHPSHIKIYIPQANIKRASTHGPNVLVPVVYMCLLGNLLHRILIDLRGDIELLDVIHSDYVGKYASLSDAREFGKRIV